MGLLKILILILSGNFIIINNTILNENQISQDICADEKLVIGLQTSNRIFIEGDLPIAVFQEELSLVVISKRHKTNFEIKNFTIVGIAENKDPIIIKIVGGKINKEYINEFLKLGNNSTLFFENISANCPSDCCNRDLPSLKYKIK